MALIKEIDYGTPIRLSEKTVTLTIDGQSVTVPAGTSVMAAAMPPPVQLSAVTTTCRLSAATTPRRSAASAMRSLRSGMILSRRASREC